MGFSSKPPKPLPPPPPVTTNAVDVAYAAQETRRKQTGRSGYQSTLLAAMPVTGLAKKTLLGG